MTNTLSLQELGLIAEQTQASPHVSQAFGEMASQRQASTRVLQMLGEIAYGPTATKSIDVTQCLVQVAYTAGATNLAAHASQILCQIAYSTSPPSQSRQQSWTFVLDGHRFYVLPLGAEGDWAYDTTTKEWCQLQTQGFNGLNFTKGVMWGPRVMGGDAQYSYLLEMDPNQPFDDGWRPIQRVVTGGVATRSRANIGVGSFSLTASVGDDQSVSLPISLAFSDDNGVSWSQEFPIPLTNVSSQLLIWNALGSFSAPGRVFRVTDYAGPVRLDGADCVLNVSSGADSSQDQDSSPIK